ncbi:hypothetical protein M409DRAFT_54760 [Zasmidium cellare ATCC 36951]|uniref:O-methyltransferase C-terminal domain-containing protein n=1 Tax=Zasmidium cellare ATCC 36951 TaxID=1080233 RepID=A0A6A6CL12_ZASCE|nr:uncharacterized protein M409DRAFT_54760 [Zasmidium cellare ATCC 36951]KAF2166409.1 hypothetical protein M409DRAFT_54760 [Zasmidium cellare ATCC 36951]
MGSMGKSQTLVEFADQVADTARAIAAFCKSRGYPEPTLHPSETEKALDILPVDAPLDVQIARQDLIDAAKRVQQIATDPAQFLPELAVHPQHIACIQWLCRFHIPGLVPSPGTVSYEELANLANVPLDVLKSVVRMAICAHFFDEPKPGHIAHTRLSAHFAKSAALQDWAEFLADATVPMAIRFADATQRWGATKSKTETAFNIALDTDLPFFDYLNKTPDFRKRFAGYMQCVTSTQGTAIEHLIEGFDWASVGNGLVVDIGGSSGHASIALARSYPELRLIVQDLPKVIETSVAQASSLEDSVKSRVTFQGHSFFEPQPVKDADLYLLRMILHDWPNDEAKTILGHIRQAMKPTARLVIMDTALPEPGTISLSQESQLRVRDLTMRETFNAHEREMEEWKALLAEVDKGWKVKRAVQPFGSNLSVMEIA